MLLWHPLQLLITVSLLSSSFKHLAFQELKMFYLE